MTAFEYSDGTPVKVGDRVRLVDGQWSGIVEECVEGPGTAAHSDIQSGSERGELVRYDEAGLVFYLDQSNRMSCLPRARHPRKTALLRLALLQQDVQVETPTLRAGWSAIGL